MTWTTLGNKPFFGDEKPGEFPFTRGLHADGYRTRVWTMRQYSGFGTPEETNQRFKYLLEQGQTGLSIAFDLPTQMGLDCDSPRAKGEVGRLGVSVASARDMEVMLAGIPLDRVSISMTINATAPILVAMLQVAGERRGLKASEVSGTAQNDILKEYVARGTYIYRPAPSLEMAADLIAYCSKHLPKFNAISVSGYHMRDAGCTIEQEMGFAVANARAYMDAVVSMGVPIDDFAPRISWIFNTSSEFFAEVAKYRALRRLWAKLLRDEYGAKNPRSWQLRVHTQTGGATLTAQQPENNIVRAAYQALSAVIGGVQSLALSCYDEALAIPTERAQTLSLRTQQIIAHETGVTETVDPLGGSPYIEALTDELEARANACIAQVAQAGGPVRAIESGWLQAAIDESSYRFQQQVEKKERVIVGVNRYTTDAVAERGSFFRLDPASEDRSRAKLQDLRRSRDSKRCDTALAELRKHAETQGARGITEKIAQAVRADATVGEIAGSLRQVFGEHHQSARHMK